MPRVMQTGKRGLAYVEIEPDDGKQCRRPDTVGELLKGEAADRSARGSKSRRPDRFPIVQIDAGCSA
jgi:hypothetical protein